MAQAGTLALSGDFDGDGLCGVGYRVCVTVWIPDYQAFGNFVYAVEKVMLCLENVRFEILRDPIVHDFSLNLQHGEVKALFGPSGCIRDDGFAFDCGLGNAEIGHDTQYFPQNGFSVSGNRLPENLTAMQNIAIFMDKPMKAKSSRWRRKSGWLRAIWTNIRPNCPAAWRNGQHFAPAAVRHDLALLDGAVRRFGPRFARYFGPPCWWKSSEQGMACMLVTHDRFSRTPEPMKSYCFH